MNTYLKESRKLLSLMEPLCIVVGNESCDLDSAVSAICLAFFYSKNISKLPRKVNKHILPLMNIKRVQLPLKTEVTYFLKENQIELENLICCDEIPQKLLDISSFVLVDHHVSKFKKQAIQAIDHRPFDDLSNLPENCCVTLEEVGSCATLIADFILKANDQYVKDDLNELLTLLYAPIVLDTVNFSRAADKARPLDFLVGEEIENTFEINDTARFKIFADLVNARSNISGLDSLQILSKDLKIISNRNNTKFVAIPGYPIPVQEYIKMQDAEQNVIKFGSTNKCDVVLMMGMKIINGEVQRDLAVINLTDIHLFNRIVDELFNSVRNNLRLEIQRNCNFLNGVFGKQNNIKISRKQLLPILKTFLDNM